jgi:tRNA G18 (ribose-2'-O)-methylase SpoU
LNYFSEELGIEAGLKLSRLRIVLVGTSHPGNIGAAARAMKVMGLDQLHLVKPVIPNSTSASVLYVFRLKVSLSL